MIVDFVSFIFFYIYKVKRKTSVSIDPTGLFTGAETRDQLLIQISALKMKIKGSLKLSHGDEITANVFSVSSKQIEEYINEIEICNLQAGDVFPF